MLIILFAALLRPPAGLAASAAAVLLRSSRRAAERQRLGDVKLDRLRRAHVAAPAAQPRMFDGRRRSRLRNPGLVESVDFKNLVRDHKS